MLLRCEQSQKIHSESFCPDISNIHVLWLSILCYRIPTVARYDIQKLFNPTEAWGHGSMRGWTCDEYHAVRICVRVEFMQGRLSTLAATVKEGYLQFTSLIVRTSSPTQSVLKSFIMETFFSKPGALKMMDIFAVLCVGIFSVTLSFIYTTTLCPLIYSS